MKAYYCDSDIGSALIGNKDWTFAVPNMGGDGTTTIQIFDDIKEFTEYATHNKLEFVSSVQGTFNIYSYDCAFDAPDDEIITTLSGRYGIYSGEFAVIFVKWE